MKIIHLTGCICAGKTFVREHFNIPHFDMLEFYQKYGIIQNESFNWNKFWDYVPDMKDLIQAKIDDCEREHNPAIIIESSGASKILNGLLLKQAHEVIQIAIKFPTNKELVERCKIRQMSLNYAQRFNIQHCIPGGISVIEAIEQITKIIEENSVC